MDTQLEVSVLRIHSAYVTQLATELTTILGALEPAAISVDTQGERIAELRRLLLQEAETFCKRLQDFLAHRASHPKE